jgi:putative ABC transport system permease protein
MQVADLRAQGWSEEAAMAEAVRRFGDRTRVEREVAAIDASVESDMRRARMFSDIGRDVRLSIRSLLKRPGFAAVTIGILGLGIGANAAVFSLVDGALWRPLALPDADRLLFVQDVQQGEPGYPASLPELDDWSRESDFAFGLLGWATNRYALTGEGEAESVRGVLVRGSAADVLRARPVVGRWFGAAEMQNTARVAVLSEQWWRSRWGGEENVLGRSIRLDGEPYTIIGVAPRAANVLLGGRIAELWLPMQEQPFMTRGMHFIRVVARLADDVTIEQARERVGALAEALQESGVTRHGIDLVSVRDELVGESRSLLLVLLGAVAVVLLVVCANVANLLLTRALGRQREFALRAALGASRFRLIRQVLLETLLLACAGGAAGLLIARVVRAGVHAVSSSAAMLAPDSVIDARVLLFTVAAAMLVAVLASLLPALSVLRGSLARVIEDGGGRSLGSRAAMRRRRFLVGLEFALSVVLLAGAGLLVRSMTKLIDQDTGFDASNVLTFSIALPQPAYTDERLTQFYEDVRSRLESVNGVETVGLGSHVPLGGGDTNGGFSIVGRSYPEGESPASKKRIVTPGYFEALGIPLLRGRTFRESDRMGSAEVVIITATLAEKYWPGEEPLGRRVRFSWGPGDEQEIVGIVGDVRHDGLDQPMDGMIFRPATQFPFPGMSVFVRASGEPLALAAAVRREIATLDANLPLLGLRTMESVVTESVGSRGTTMRLMSGFALLALILSAVGMYAVTAQSMTQRTREIGVRMAIGAKGGDVIRMVVREELPILGLGLGMGLLSAAAATQVLEASLFGISARDPLTFGAAALVLVAAALAAILLPSRRAARLDPVRALRAE